MKNLTFFLALILVAFNCKSKSPVAQHTVTSIILSETTRGTQRVFKWTPENIEKSVNGNIATSPILLSDWNSIVKTANEIDVNKISTFQSTSTKRFTDAALASVITITKDGKEYHSTTFDSGNPPKELKNLYDLIRKLTENKKSN